MRWEVGGVVGYEVVEEARGNDAALGDASWDRSAGGERVTEGASGRPTLEVAGQPADQIGVKRRRRQLGDELRVGDGVESFGKIGGKDGSASRGFALVETYCDGLGQRQEGGCGGTEGTETVLRVGEGEGGGEVRK